MKQFITLLMLFAFTISFAMPKDNLSIKKSTTHEKVFTTTIDNPVIVIDFKCLQLTEVDRTNIKHQNYGKGFSIFNIQESGFISGVPKSRFSKNSNTYKQNFAKTYRCKVETFYSTNIKKRPGYPSRMYLRGIQKNDNATERSNYTTKRNYHFKRKYGNLSGLKNSKLGNAINMDWRSLCFVDCSQIIKV